MSKSYIEITQNISKSLRSFRAQSAGTLDTFNAMGKSAMAAGAIDALHKELMALAIGVASRCDGCIGFHTKSLVNLGATPEQIRETLEVAIYMGGGPSVMYAAEALQAYDEFSAAKQASTA